ncbi:MAG: hypothetical protein ACFFCE_13750 [Promethearchaeota archaeon]
MKHDKILKFLQIVGLTFIIISLAEIVFFIVIHFAPFNLDGDSLLLSEFIYISDMISLSGTLLWVFLIIAMVSYLILGIFMYKIIISKSFESWALAKYMIIIGMVILLGGFVKMDFLVLLGKIRIKMISDSIRFQTALYDSNITPIFPAILWIIFISINCYTLIIGLCVTGIGIKWTLLQEEELKINR